MIALATWGATPGTTSGAVQLSDIASGGYAGSWRVAGIIVPAAGWSAANISFEVSDDGQAWSAIEKDDGAAATAISIASGTITGGKLKAFIGDLLAVMAAGFNYIRLVSSVNQSNVSVTLQLAER